jgi:hypothetical protein
MRLIAFGSRRKSTTATTVVTSGSMAKNMPKYVPRMIARLKRRYFVGNNSGFHSIHKIASRNLP